MKAVKTIAALIFLTVVAVVLVQPVLGADDDAGHRAGRDGASPSATSEAPPDGSDEAGDVRITSRYPRRCTRKTTEAPSGLVAARRGSTALVGFPDQDPVARLDVSGDVAWSASGTFLAERGGRVFDQSGNPQGALFFEPRQWQWSPVADCALATTERGNLTFSIPDTKRKGIRLMDSPVTQFELSPNGRRLAVVTDRGGLWIADLRRGRVVQATGGRASLVGWFSNRAVLYSKSKERGKLRYATGDGETRIVRKASAGGSLVRCAGRTFLTGSAARSAQPLVELTSRRGRVGRTVLSRADGYDGYSGVACSPDGTLIAAAAVVRGDKGPLVLLQADGTFVRELVPGRTASPQWSTAGLMFVRFENGDGRLWLIGPGSDPFPTGYRVGAPTQYDWHVR